MADPVLARKLIQEAARQAVLAGQLADRHAAYAKRLDQDVAVAKSQLAASDPLVVHGLKDVQLSLKTAADSAGTQDYGGATAALDKALAQIADIAAARLHSEKLKARLPLFDALLTQVSNVAPRTDLPPAKKNAAIREAARLRKLHDDTKVALGEAPADLKALDAALTQGQADAEALKARAMLSAAGSSKDAVKLQMDELMNQSGGQALLDKLIREMGPDDDTAHVLAALETRFKLTAGATDEGTGTAKAGMAELKRIYALMADVPAKHTRNNPNLKNVTRKPAGGSEYGGGNMTLGDGPGTIALPRVPYGGTGVPPPNCLGDPRQLPDVEDACKLDSSAPPPRFFDWNVQHEIAHALDDRKGFMDSRAGDLAFGGWEDHGGDVLAIANAAAAEFASLPGVKANMIATYLDSGTSPSPPPAGWAKVTAWADLTGDGTNPWDQGALCGKSALTGGLMLGQRIYHQAYASHWVSYAAAARKQGITGYQFRSSGEWFSELYAAYKSRVLKTSHPAYAWLSKLFGERQGNARG